MWCGKQREAVASIQSLIKLQPWFLSLRWKTCLRQSCSLGEGPALGQNTLVTLTLVMSYSSGKKTENLYQNCKGILLPVYRPPPENNRKNVWRVVNEIPMRHYLFVLLILYLLYVYLGFKGASTSKVIGAHNEMMMDDYYGQMIFGDLVGLKLPDIRLTGEEKPRKKLTQETCPDRG